MTMIENLRRCANDNLEPEQRASLEPDVALAALNTILVTSEMLAGAMDALSRLGEEDRSDPIERALALQSFVLEQGLEPIEMTAASLDARIAAMYKWQAVNDPDVAIDPDHQIGATARSPLVLTEHGVGFDDDRHSELIEFIEVMPW